jgi:hypothetical protein
MSFRTESRGRPDRRPPSSDKPPSRKRTFFRASRRRRAEGHGHSNWLLDTEPPVGFARVSFAL